MLLVIVLAITSNITLVKATIGLYQVTPDVTFSSRFYTNNLYVHDMNGDGANDVLIAGYEGPPNYGGFEIHLQTNPGKYSNTPDVCQYIATNTSWIQTTGADAGDFDNDGDLDVAGGGSSAGVRGWFYSQESGFTFIHTQQLITDGPMSVEAADFNDDELMDISIAEPVSGVIRIWLQRESGGFNETSTYEICPCIEWPYYYIEEYTVEDLNGDGLTDVLMSYEERVGEQTIPRNFTTAVFYQPQNGWPSGESPLNLTLPDVILSKYVEGSNIFPVGIGTGDLNNDGQNDVAVLITEFYNVSGNHLLVFLNNDTGILGEPSYAVPMSGQHLPHHFGDLNNDGKDDVLVGSPVRAYFQNSTNQIPETPCFTTTTGAKPFAIADMNMDGYNDILAGCGNTVYIWFAKNIFEVPWQDSNYTVTSLSNSTIANFNFNHSLQLISFNVTGGSATIGYCNVSIPKKLMWCDTLNQWDVSVENSSINNLTITEDTTYTFLYFTYNHSTHEVIIKAAFVIPEFPSAIILPIFMLTTLLTVIILRRKHSI